MHDATLELHAAALTLLERLLVVRRAPGKSVLSAIGQASRRHAPLFREVAKQRTGVAQSPRYDTPPQVLHAVLGGLASTLRSTAGWDTRDAHAPAGWRQAFDLAAEHEPALERPPERPAEPLPAPRPRPREPSRPEMALAG